MDIIYPNPYGQLANEQLARFEKKIGVKLPDSYRKYLLDFNGGKFSKSQFYISNEHGNSTIHHVYGIHDGPSYSQLDSIAELFKGRIKDWCLPIADDDGGNKVCIGIYAENREKIYYWDHESGALILLHMSFDEFVESLEDAPISTNEIDIILDADDVTKMDRLLSSGYDSESLDEYGRSMIERAVIKAKPMLVEYLASKGCDFRNSLELAQQNAEFFEEHNQIVDLLIRLKNYKK